MKKFFIYLASMLFIFLLFNLPVQAANNNNENTTVPSQKDKRQALLPYLPKVKPLKSKIFKKTSLEIAALKKAAISYYEKTGAWPLDAERLKAFGLKEWKGKSSWGTPISFYVKNGEFIISNEAPDNLHAAFEGFGRVEKDKKTGKVNIHIAPPDSIKIRDNARLFEQDIIISKSDPTLRLEDINASDSNLTDANTSDSNISDANNSISLFIMNKNGELVVLDNQKLPNIRVKQQGDVEIKGNLSAVSNSIQLKNIENESSSIIEMADAARRYKAVLRVGDKYKNNKEEAIPEGFQMGTVSKHPVTMLVNNSPRLVIDEENLSSPNINAVNINSGDITADNIKINKTVNGEDITKLLDGLIVLINSKELFGIINRNEKLMTEANIEDYAISIAGTKALVGDIIPAIASKYIIGSSARSFKAGYFDSIYISGSSLYMDGVKVLSSEGAVLNGDISGSGVKTVIDENNPSDVKLASEKAITDYIQDKVANISGISGQLKLGGDFITTGDITLNVMSGGTTEITLPVTGTLATREWTLAQNLSANIALSDLTNVADNLSDDAGNILIWDNSGILQSKALIGDVSVNQNGVATVKGIGGKPITLGDAFETVNPIKLEASKDVTVKIEDSGTLATQAYVIDQMANSNISAATTLVNLTDTDITPSGTSGDIIIWDATNKKWINKKVSYDVSLEKSGAATVQSIGGKSISLEAEFKTTGDKTIELNAPTQNVVLTIEDTGVVATKEYVSGQMDDAMLGELTSPVSGDLAVWDGSKNKWVNRSVYQDISLEKDGKATVEKIGGKSISLGAEFKTTGSGNIEFNASAPVSIEIRRSGVLATIADINDHIIAAGEAARLEDLTDVSITPSGTSGDIIIWDAISGKWVNKKVYQDISLEKDGKATVTSIAGKSISLGAEFKTTGSGNIEFNASAPVSVAITDSGTLATKDYVEDMMVAANSSATLENLTDTVVSATISGGDLLIWDGSSEWVSRSLSGDINL
ncbi:MAG: hypothetical protein JRJ49_06965, partial [Deltaproteobacteria bacterium]|nr:hypothetical protein [Deltaproteobacteria bacterium]